MTHEEEINEIKRLRKLCESPILNGIYEYVSREIMDKYCNEIWDIIVKSYQKIGGFLTYDNPQQMINNVSLVKMYFSNSKLEACALYRGSMGGQKLVACGTLNRTDEQKKALKQMIKADIDKYDDWHWAEVSGTVEMWFAELGGNPIPSELAFKILQKSKKAIKLCDDGVHYERVIGTENARYKKIIYGFKDLKTYERVMKKIDEYENFESYEDWKKSVNNGILSNRPKIHESYDYLDNDEDPETAYYIEMGVQSINVWEDGVREVPQKMYNLFQTTYNFLLQKQNKNNQINCIIREMEYVLKNMQVLTIHPFKPIEDYIIAPSL